MLRQRAANASSASSAANITASMPLTPLLTEHSDGRLITVYRCKQLTGPLRENLKSLLHHNNTDLSP